MKFDMEILGKDIATMVKTYVAQSIKELSYKVDSLKLQKGEKGEDGKSVTIDEVKPLILEEIKQAVSLIPTPKDGEKGEKGDAGINGKDAVDVDVDLVVDRLYFKLFASDEFAQRLVKLIPVPKDGKNGADGKDGANGLDGKDGQKGIDGKDAVVDYVAIGNTIKEHIKQIELPKPKEIDEENIVKSVIEKMPTPKDGKDGADGLSVDKKEVIDEVLKAIPAPKNGENGKDGTSVSVDDLKPFLDASIAKWQLDFERIAYDTLQKSVAMFPKPEKGEKGQDGFGIDSFEQTDERTVKAVFKRGDELIEKEFKFPAVIYKGVYQKGLWQEGDAVTYAGSLWIAKRDTEDTPSQSDAWQLSVKRGSNGKDADKA